MAALKRIILLSGLLTVISWNLCLSDSYKVLFIGNSYTYVNDLPKMISEMAFSIGDTLTYDMNCPGGTTLKAHSTNTESLNKIKAGNWDYVVLQDQSQYPSFPDAQVNIDVFPFAKKLDSIIRASGNCTETVFYMTWGRKNGDASNCPNWSPVCTYEGMDSLLHLRYMQMALNNNAIVSPVGAVWHKIRISNPEIELYQADESHPSVYGTYAAALTFYTTLYRKDPEKVVFNSTIEPATAAIIKSIVKATVYDSLYNWYINKYDPLALFDYQIKDNNTVEFKNKSVNSDTYYWDFGDGESSDLANPIHKFSQSTNYEVKLSAKKCKRTDNTSKQLSLSNLNIQGQSEARCKVLIDNNSKTIRIDSDESDEITYKVFDTGGKQVDAGSFSSSIKEISSVKYSTGTYYLILYKADNFICSQSIIIQ